MTKLSAVSIGTLSLVLCGIVIGCSANPNELENQTVHAYSARHYTLDHAFNAFTDKTGINVEFLVGSDVELRERLKVEKDATDADTYITVDEGSLTAATQQDIFVPTNFGDFSEEKINASAYADQSADVVALLAKIGHK